MTRIIGAGGGGGGGCFLGHTLVAVPNGTKRIDKLAVGDNVLSFDDAGKLHEAKVLKVHQHEDERVLRYKLWGGQCIDATPNHWVLNQFNAFVEIDTLGPDDCLVDVNDHLRPIISKEELCKGTVYNLTVEGHHTFIAEGIRVHNAGLGLGVTGAGGGGGGGKGGGGSQSVPTEADDSLQSTQFATVLDLLSEGEIQGLDNGLKSVFLDNTPVVSSSGANNFTGYTTEFKTGTQAQTYIAGTQGIESETGVNVEATASSPVTRSITDTDVDRVRVTIQLPALQIIEDDGDIIGHSVNIKFQVQYNGGGFTDVINDTISGKTTNSYQRDYIIALTGAFPVDIKMVRVSADEVSARRQNRTFWFSFTEILDEKLRYPNSALSFLRFDSRQFQNIPTRKYLIRGIKVELPSNATVDTTTHLGRVTYSGVWDGTFGAATWCADPAWCLWDLLISTRYGPSIPETSLDRYDFFAISQYCNELVSDGFGGQEPRFQVNLLINSREEVYNVIQQFVSIFRGIAYYGAGSMVIMADKPSDPQYLLGPANVIDGNFSYSGSSQKSRHTTATVAYQTYDGLGEVEFEYVEDADAITKFGVINKDIKAFGCYSRGQAHRLGKWALLMEQNLTETVTFAVSIDSGIVLRPGVVISIADPVKSGSRRLGRITAASTTAVTVDSVDGLPTTTANAPTISALLPTGLVETRAISGISGNIFTVSNAFSEAPNAQSVFLIETNDIQANLFRVISVAEGDGGVFSCTALQYNESLYAAIESDLNLVLRDISNLSTIPDPPSSINGTEHLYQDGQSVLTAFELSWISPRTRVAGFQVEYRMDNDNWIKINTTSPSTRLTNLRNGRLYVQVRSVNSLNAISTAAIADFTLLGKTAVPGDVQNLTIEAINANSARLRWDQTVDLDVKVGGKVHIKHSNLTDGTATWSNSVDLILAKAGSATEAIVPLVEGEILVKFEDDGGRQSTNETSVIVDFPDALGQYLIQSRRENLDSPPFQGVKTDTFYSADVTGLVLQGAGLFDAIVDFDLVPSLDFLGDVEPTGEYAFLSGLDLEAVYALDLKRYFVTTGFFPNDLIDSRTANIDTWSDFDGGVIDRVNAKLYLRRTPDDPAALPTWSAWQEFVNGTFIGRGFEFKTELTSAAIDQNIAVNELGYEATFQRRQEQSAGPTASGAGTLTVTFDKAFFTGTTTLGGVNTSRPSIGIVAQDMNSGDYFRVTNSTSTSFQVTFFDSSNTAVNRNFLWSAVGYGKSV
jgi:predicted phage tail protein